VSRPRFAPRAASRRQVLGGLAAVGLATLLPVSPAIAALAKAPALPGLLSLVPLEPAVVDVARSVLRAHRRRAALEAWARAFWRAPEHQAERHAELVRQDARAGRSLTVAGWVLTETELAVLASATVPA
jgi:hypothetical protein